MKIPELDQPGLQEQPFGIPEGYFDALPGRLQERIQQMEKAPVQKFYHSSRFRIAVAASLVGLALITYATIRVNTAGGLNEDLALYEEMNHIDDAYYLMDYMEEGSAGMDEDEAFFNQAAEYLAMNDLDPGLYFD